MLSKARFLLSNLSPVGRLQLQQSCRAMHISEANVLATEVNRQAQEYKVGF